MAPPGPGEHREGDSGLVRDVVLGVERALTRHGIELSAQERADIIGRVFELVTAGETGSASERLAEAADVIVRYERLHRRDRK